MDDINKFAEYYIKQIGGADDTNAYHRLIEADNSIVPFLIIAFRSEKNPHVRAKLVEIIWQHRVYETIEFLSVALDDPNPEVWKSALDGFVTIGGKTAIHSLEANKNRLSTYGKSKTEHIKWIDEAIQQTREKNE